jgi:hypothetical protein
MIERIFFFVEPYRKVYLGASLVTAAAHLLDDSLRDIRLRENLRSILNPIRLVSCVAVPATQIFQHLLNP